MNVSELSLRKWIVLGSNGASSHIMGRLNALCKWSRKNSYIQGEKSLGRKRRLRILNRQMVYPFPSQTSSRNYKNRFPVPVVDSLHREGYLWIDLPSSVFTCDSLTIFQRTDASYQDRVLRSHSTARPAQNNKLTCRPVNWSWAVTPNHPTKHSDFQIEKGV